MFIVWYVLFFLTLIFVEENSLENLSCSQVQSITTIIIIKQGWGLGWANWLGKKPQQTTRQPITWQLSLSVPDQKKLLFHWLSVNDFCLQLMPCSFWLFLCSLSGKWLCRLVFCIALNLYLVCFKIKTDLTECIERSGVPLLMQQAVRKLQSAQVGTFH